MRVLIYGLNFAPELVGIGKYTGELAQFLSQQGISVRVVTAPPYYPQWKIGAGYRSWRYQKEHKNGILVFRCPLWVPITPSGIKRLLHLMSFALSSLPVMVAQLFWKPDLLFVVAPALVSAPVGLAIARISGAKAWLHIQDFELDAAMQLGILPGFKPIYLLFQKLEIWLLRGFDRVSTISNKMLTLLGQKQVPLERSVLIPNWVDTGFIYPTSRPNAMHLELTIPDNQITVLYAGNMGQKQGIELLIDAARLLQGENHIKFILCGEGSARQELELKAEGLNNLTFLPLQPLDRLNDLLNLADIHVLPQRAGAADLVMPSKLTGMLASGKPVIVTASEETEIADELEGIVRRVPPGDPQAITKEILLLAWDNILRESIGSKGRAFVVGNWSSDIILSDVLVKFSRITQSKEG